MISESVIFWTMSPHSYGNFAYVNNIDAKSIITWGGNTAEAWGTRPVIALQSIVTYLSRNGTSNSPYRIN